LRIEGDDRLAGHQVDGCFGDTRSFVERVLHVGLAGGANHSVHLNGD